MTELPTAGGLDRLPPRRLSLVPSRFAQVPAFWFSMPFIHAARDEPLYGRARASLRPADRDADPADSDARPRTRRADRPLAVFQTTHTHLYHANFKTDYGLLKIRLRHAAESPGPPFARDAARRHELRRDLHLGSDLRNPRGQLVGYLDGNRRPRFPDGEEQGSAIDPLLIPPAVLLPVQADLDSRDDWKLAAPGGLTNSREQTRSNRLSLETRGTRWMPTARSWADRGRRCL